MYIPQDNQMKDQDRILAFMQRFSFATLITAKDNMPVATHLPFLVKEEEGKLWLYSHCALQNEQWQDIETAPVLVIFSEPHAYISPSYYEKEVNVPTWNYLSIHAYGKGQLIKEPGAVIELLEATIDNYEAGYREQWKRLPEKYINALCGELVAFKIEITDLQAKEKLSQNKMRKEQANIIAGLGKSTDHNERIIADYMQENMDRTP